DEFALTHVGLNKLFLAAGGSWLHQYSRRIDDRSDSNLVVWKAVGTMRDPTGFPVPKGEHAQVDLRDGSPQIKGWTEDRLLEARKFIMERAESRAENRVIRKFLAIRSKWKEADIRKPFVV